MRTRSDDEIDEAAQRVEEALFGRDGKWPELRNAVNEVCEKLMTSQRILQAYSTIPEDQRTSLRIASELKAAGCVVTPDRVNEVLRATVLHDLFDASELVAAAKVLRTLIDFSVQFPHSGDYTESVKTFAYSITDGLDHKDGKSARTISKIRNAIAQCIQIYLEREAEEQQIGYYEREPGRYSEGANRVAADDDIPF